MSTNSKRAYKAVIHEPIDGFHSMKLTIDEIMFPKDKNAFEYIYALQDIIDKVLDLPRGHSMYFNPDRDKLNSKGIIWRVE